MRNIAVILAGGSGTRLGGDIPKQYLEVGGKSIIEHTIDVFEQNAHIDEIAVVCHPDYAPRIEQVCAANGYRKVGRILHGGKERYHSSLAAIEAYGDDCNLLLHDAVRPLVTHRVIDDCIEALRHHEAVDVAVPTTDTIVHTDGQRITAIPPRAELRNSQTPQCFRRRLICEAYERALQDPDFQTTDDCGVVFRYMPHVPIYIVGGEVFNLKVTYREDLPTVERLLAVVRG